MDFEASWERARSGRHQASVVVNGWVRGPTPVDWRQDTGYKIQETRYRKEKMNTGCSKADKTRCRNKVT